MAWLCVLFFLIFAAFGKVVKGRWSNLLTMFSAFFAITILFANLRFYGIDKISDDAGIIILIGMASYLVGYTVLCGVHQRKVKNSPEYTYNIARSILEDNKVEIRKRLVDIMLLFAVVYSIFRLYVLLTLLRSGYSYIQIRTIYFNSQAMFEGSLGSIYGRNQLDIYLYQPVLLALIIIAAIVFFTNALNYNQKQKVKFVSSVFLCTALTAISNGGREIMYYFILIFVFCFFIVRKKQIMGGGKT